MYDRNTWSPFVLAASTAAISIGCALILRGVPELRPKRAEPEPQEGEALPAQEAHELRGADEPPDTPSADEAHSRRLTADDVRSDVPPTYEVGNLELA